MIAAELVSYYFMSFNNIPIFRDLKTKEHISIIIFSSLRKNVFCIEEYLNTCFPPLVLILICCLLQQLICSVEDIIGLFSYYVTI